MGWLEDVKKTAGTEKWLELVQTLRGVTEGKVRLRYMMKTIELTSRSDILGDSARPRYPPAGPLPRRTRRWPNQFGDL